jgi:hypothetical protein
MPRCFDARFFQRLSRSRFFPLIGTLAGAVAASSGTESSAVRIQDSSLRPQYHVIELFFSTNCTIYISETGVQLLKSYFVLQSYKHHCIGVPALSFWSQHPPSRLVENGGDNRYQWHLQHAMLITCLSSGHCRGWLNLYSRLRLRPEFLSVDPDGSWLTGAPNYSAVNNQFDRAVTIQENRPANGQFNMGPNFKSLIGRECNAAATHVYGLAGPGGRDQIVLHNLVGHVMIKGESLLWTPISRDLSYDFILDSNAFLKGQHFVVFSDCVVYCSEFRTTTSSQIIYNSFSPT